MKGIRLSHGVVFATDGSYTVRLLASGECGISPVSYNSLEWELRTEPPHTWDYVFEEDLRKLPNGGYEKICAAFDKIHSVLCTQKE